MSTLAIIVLLGFSGYMIWKLKETKKIHQNNLERELKNLEQTYQDHLVQAHKEASAALQQAEVMNINQKNEFLNENDFLKNKIVKMDEYINNLKKYSRNSGEVITHTILTELKEKLISEGKINENEMVIMGNVFVPYEENGETKTRQIDHLVILPSDIYIIETKYWRGTVIHGINRKNAESIANDFSFVFEQLFPKANSDTEKTIIFMKNSNIDKDSEQKNSINISYYDNPRNQVMHTMYKLRNFLITYNNKFNYVEPIVYFGYPEDKENRVIDYSTKDKNRFTSKASLCEYFKNEVLKPAKYTVDEIQQIKRIMQKVNYLS
ncbi:nuclease-related domain-containing protein [Bacillus licheniformis]|uniref:nuclease-related domain-containing protein n=1 Tax=Bacillus licheniformis TaxID=1402 RepID=UPI003672595B